MQYPKHIAIIPDGNRTRAKERELPSMIGHLQGFNQMVKIASHVIENTPIEVFTLRGLSTENLSNRSAEELSYLFDLYKHITKELQEILAKHQINIRIAGDLGQLPSDLQAFCREQMETFNYPESHRYFVLAINYGGQDELLRAMRKLSESWEEITKTNLEKYMDFWGLPPVELLIRTKQQYAKRLSGFMLWRIGYAQLYFTDNYCPDFDIPELEEALKWRNESLETQNFWK